MRRSILTEGVLVGLAGATTVAVWFLLYDLAAGVPFRTPALLAAALFHGLRDAADLVITPRLVLEYTAVHGLAFAGFGVVLAGLFSLADRDRRVLFAIFMLLCCFEVFFLAMVMVVAEGLFETLAPWSIVVGNLLASVVMLGVLFRRHHLAPRQLLTAGE
jgi:hypothetical protein